jgi:hypothetical protein
MWIIKNVQILNVKTGGKVKVIIIIRSIRNIFNNMKNELALFIAIIVSCAILFMSTIIKGNIISAQANNNNNSSMIPAAANKTAVEAQSADAFYEQYWTCNKAFHC